MDDTHVLKPDDPEDREKLELFQKIQEMFGRNGSITWSTKEEEWTIAKEQKN